MIKYNDIINTLTLVNILAKDVNYGNVKQEISNNCDCDGSTFCNLQVCRFSTLTISKVCNLSFIKFKYFCETIFLKVNKILIIFLQRILLYCQQLKLEYG